ncbi:MAG: B-box zinc finger protein [Bacillota bacterium]
MDCKYHKERPSEYVCSVCHQPICEECKVEISGKKVCSQCVDTNLFNSHKHRKDISKFWSFIFSLIPGCGQMYMGLMNRGLQLLSAFILIILLGTMTEEIIIPISLIVWFYSFFDSLNTRKLLVRGQQVEDKIVYNVNLSKINTRYIAIGLIVIAGFSLLKNLFYAAESLLRQVLGRQFPLFWLHDIQRNLVPVALIILGIYLLRKSKNKEAHGSKEGLQLEIYEEE